MDKNQSTQNQDSKQSQSQNQQEQFSNLFGEKFISAHPQDKVQHVIETFEKNGFIFKKDKQKEFVGNMTSHLTKNPKLSRYEVIQHAYSEVDPTWLDENSNQSQGSRQPSTEGAST